MDFRFNLKYFIESFKEWLAVKSVKIKTRTVMPLADPVSVCVASTSNGSTKVIKIITGFNSVWSKASRFAIGIAAQSALKFKLSNSQHILIYVKHIVL